MPQPERRLGKVARRGFPRPGYSLRDVNYLGTPPHFCPAETSADAVPADYIRRVLFAVSQAVSPCQCSTSDIQWCRTFFPLRTRNAPSAGPNLTVDTRCSGPSLTSPKALIFWL